MEPTPQQLAKWEKAKKIAWAVNQMTKAAMMRAETISEGIRIGRANGVDLPAAIAFISEVQNLQQTDVKLQNIISAVETGELGIRDSNQSGDIDVMAHPGTPDEQLIQYNLGGIITVIVIGVIVVYGLATTAYSQYHRANRIKAKYEESKEYCGERLKELSPTAYQNWLTFLRSPSQTARESVWDDIEAAAKSALKVGLSSLQIGLIIGIPLAAYYLFGRQK